MYNWAREWHMWPPRVFRYLEQRFIDDFFRDGVLRLKSFASFGEHEDEQRRDVNDGWAGVKRTVGSYYVQYETSMGGQSYVLSTSVIESETLGRTLSPMYDGRFRINNTVAFAAAVGHALPHWTGGLEGPCIYAVERLIALPSVCEGEPPTHVPLQSTPASFFVKDRRFSGQAEYRLIWHTSRDVEQYVDIVCPDARQHCTKIT